MGKLEYYLETIELEAQQLKKMLEPKCAKIEIVGSIRRQREVVHDIDLVAIPKDKAGWGLVTTLMHAGVKPGGQGKILEFVYHGYPVQLNLATPETWPILYLIRTGSRQHNIKLCQEAQRQGKILHADGSGLEDARGQLVEIKSEADIFAALGLPYAEPWERN